MNHHRFSALVSGLFLVVTITGCATYQPAPLDPAAILNNLNAIKPPSPAEKVEPSTQALGPRELAAFAVSTNPQLAATRAEYDIRQALLVEAGLLPDPEIGWDAMDVIASQVKDGTSSSVDALSGFGLMFPLPRPGERGARVDAAEWRVEEARRWISAAEWSLTRDVYLAYEELLAAELLQNQTQDLTKLVEATNDYFKRARDARAATAIQANLALGELQAMQLATVRANFRVKQAKQAINALLGLPPATLIPVQRGDDPNAHDALQGPLEQLTSRALESRPDLAILLAGYQAAEEEVRLAVTKQFPEFSIGTGLSFTLPFFSKFGGPAIRTAMAKRERLGREFKAAIHSMRKEVAAAHALWELAQQEVELIESQLLPTAEENLRLSQEAVQTGEATLLETIALQRALVETRTRHTEARAERSKRAWVLLAACGGLLAPEPKLVSNNKKNKGDAK